MGESLGPAVKLNEGYEHYWAYVSHFVPRAVLRLRLRVRRPAGARPDGEAPRGPRETFAPLYEDLLAAGGTRTYVEALKPFGLNPREKAFWAAGCAQLERWWTSSKPSFDRRT
jgi:oligoendopeptidase F